MSVHAIRNTPVHPQPLEKKEEISSPIRPPLFSNLEEVFLQLGDYHYFQHSFELKGRLVVEVRRLEVSPDAYVNAKKGILLKASQAELDGVISASEGKIKILTIEDTISQGILAGKEGVAIESELGRIQQTKGGIFAPDHTIELTTHKDKEILINGAFWEAKQAILRGGKARIVEAKLSLSLETADPIIGLTAEVNESLSIIASKINCVSLSLISDGFGEIEDTTIQTTGTQRIAFQSGQLKEALQIVEKGKITTLFGERGVIDKSTQIVKDGPIVMDAKGRLSIYKFKAATLRKVSISAAELSDRHSIYLSQQLHFKARTGNVTLQDLKVQGCVFRALAQSGDVIGKRLELQKMHGVSFMAPQGQLTLESVVEKGSGHLALVGKTLELLSGNFWNEQGAEIFGTMIHLDHTHLYGGDHPIFFDGSTLVFEHSSIEGREIRERAKSIYLNKSSEKGLIRKDASKITLLDSKFNGEALLLNGDEISVSRSEGELRTGHIVSSNELTWTDNAFTGNFTFHGERGYFAGSRHVGHFVVEKMKELDFTRFFMKGNLFSAQSEGGFQGYRMRLAVNQIEVEANDLMAPESVWKGYERISAIAKELAHLPGVEIYTNGVATFQARHLNMDWSRVDARQLERVGSESLSARFSDTRVQGRSIVKSQEGQIDVEGSTHVAKEKVTYLSSKGVNHAHSETVSEKLAVETKTFINRDGELQGDSEMQLNLFDNRAGKLKVGEERSHVSADWMVNDEKSHISGPGDFYLTSRKPHLDKGEYDLEGRLDVTAPSIQKKGKTKAERVYFDATEETITHDGELSAGRLTCTAPSFIQNLGIMYSSEESRFHSLFLDNPGEIGSGGALFVHQEQFQLPGNLWSEGRLTLSANEPLTFTTPLENRGGIGLIAGDHPITTHAPIWCGGELSMEGSELQIHENLRAGGRGIFHTPGLLHFDHMTAFFGDGLDVEADSYYSDVSRVDVYGDSSIKARKMLFGSEVTSLGNTTSSYPVRPSHMRVVGDLTLTIGEKAVNEASDLYISGLLSLEGGTLFNINRTHTYRSRERTGTKDKRFCGVRYGGTPIYADRHQQIIDRRANTHVGADIQIDMEGVIRNDGAFYGHNIRGKVGAFYNGIFHSTGRTPGLGKAPDHFAVHPSEENPLFQRATGGRYGFVGDVPTTLPDYTLEPTWLFDQLRVPYEGLTFLCDPYVEGSVVQELTQLHTGRGSFEPGQSTPLDVRRTLYNRAFTFAEKHHAQLLQPLTPSLQKEVTSPLLWYVQENRTVEPIVYLPPDWTTFRPGGDVVAIEDIDLEATTLHNRGYFEAGETLQLYVENYLNEKRLNEEMEEIVHTKSWGRHSKERVAVDHVNHGGEVIGNKVFLYLGQGRNRGGHISSREAAEIYADDFTNEPLEVRSAVHLDNGHVAPWKSAKGGSVRTDFLGGHIESGGTLLFDIKNTFLNDASHVVSMEDYTVRAGEIFQKTRFSSFQSVSEEGWLSGKDIQSIVMAEGSMTSISGDAYLQSTKGDIRIQGSVGSCAQDLIFDSARDIWMEALTHEVNNSVTETTFTPTSATMTTTDFNSTASSIPTAFSARDMKFRANRSVLWDALQLGTGRDCIVDADHFERRAHQVHKREDTTSYSLDLNFTGKAAIEAAYRGEGVTGVGEGLLCEDPLLKSAFDLARSRDSTDVFVNGVITGVRGYNTFNEFSEALANGNLGNTLTKRWGLTDENGNFDPDVSLRFGITSSATRWSESIGSNGSIARDFKVKVKTLTEQGGVTRIGGDCDYDCKQMTYRPIQDYFSNNTQGWGVTVGHSSEGFYVGGDYSQSDIVKKWHTPSMLDVKGTWRVRTDTANIEGLVADCDWLDYQAKSTTLASTLDEHDASHMSVAANTKGNISFSAGDESKRKIGTRSRIHARSGGNFKSDHLKTVSASVEGAQMSVQTRENHSLDEKEKSRSVSVSLNMKEIGNMVSGKTADNHIPELGTIHVRHNGSHWGVPLVGAPSSLGRSKAGPSALLQPTPSDDEPPPPTLQRKPPEPKKEFIPIPKQRPKHSETGEASSSTPPQEPAAQKPDPVEAFVKTVGRKVCRSSETAQKVCKILKDGLLPSEPVDPQREAELEKVYQERKKALLEMNFFEHAAYGENMTAMRGGMAQTQFLSKVFDLFGVIAEPVVNYAVSKAREVCHSTETTTKACRAAKEWWNEKASKAQKELAESSQRSAETLEDLYGIPREYSTHVAALTPGVLLAALPFGRFRVAPKVTKVSKTALHQITNKGLTPAVRQALKYPKKVHRVKDGVQKVVGKKVILTINPVTKTLLEVMPRVTVLSKVAHKIRPHIRRGVQSIRSTTRVTTRVATKRAPAALGTTNPRIEAAAKPAPTVLGTTNPRIEAARKRYDDYARSLEQEQSALLSLTRDIPQIGMPEGLPPHLNKFHAECKILKINGSKLGKNKEGMLSLELPFVQSGDKILFVIRSSTYLPKKYIAKKLTMHERLEYTLERALNFAYRKGSKEAYFAWEPTKQTFAIALEKHSEKILGTSTFSTGLNSKPLTVVKVAVEMDRPTLSIVEKSKQLMKQSSESHGTIACQYISDEVEKLIPLLPHKGISQEKLWKALAKTSGPIEHYSGMANCQLVRLGDIVFRDASLGYVSDMIAELNGLYLLNSLNLKEIHVSKPLFIRRHTLCNDEHAIFARSHLPGQDYKQLFVEHGKIPIGSAKRTENLFDITIAVEQLGRGIGEYTQKGVEFGVEVLQENLQRMIRFLDAHLQDVKDELPSTAWKGNRANITTNFSDLRPLVKAFEESPGLATLGCGDPHLGQYLWSKKDKALGFQDAEMLFNTLNQHWLPQSFQASDFIEIRLQLEYYRAINRFTVDEASILMDAFEKGFFSKFPRPLPQACERFFDCYHRLSLIETLAENAKTEADFRVLRKLIQDFNKKYSTQPVKAKAAKGKQTIAKPEALPENRSKPATAVKDTGEVPQAVKAEAVKGKQTIEKPPEVKEAKPETLPTEKNPDKIKILTAKKAGESKVPSVSSRKMRQLFEEVGYNVVPGRGKGSHWILKKPGRPTVTIPNNKTLPKGYANRIWKLLKQERDIK